jgi:hypothetical protein
MIADGYQQWSCIECVIKKQVNKQYFKNFMNMWLNGYVFYVFTSDKYSQCFHICTA